MYVYIPHCPSDGNTVEQETDIERIELSGGCWHGANCRQLAGIKGRKEVEDSLPELTAALCNHHGESRNSSGFGS